MLKTNYFIEQRLSLNELAKALDEYNKEYAGKIVMLRKNQEHYRISHISVLNHQGIAEYAVNYHPYDAIHKKPYSDIIHTKPAREFFDGRFCYVTYLELIVNQN